MARGAVTIVNAMASGRGVAMGIGLEIRAEVEVWKGEGVEVEIDGKEVKGLDRRVAEECFRLFSERFGYAGYGCRIRTWSEIPIARGLKSSSASSNCIMLALKSAFGVSIDDLELVKLGVEASRRAGVTMTGAFDDACASYFGGMAFTDNYGMKLMKREEVDEGLKVAIMVPEERAYTKDVRREEVEGFKALVDLIFDLAMNGKAFEAMTLNGLVYSSIFGYDTKAAILAIRAGALGAGLSGKGPSVVAVGYEDQIGRVVDAWRDFGAGELILTNASNERARVVE